MIMMSLFDEEQIMKSFIKSERHDADRETAERMIKNSKMSLEEIADYVPALLLDELREIMQSVLSELLIRGAVLMRLPGFQQQTISR